MSDWIARHGDGWMLYPRDVPAQASVISTWERQVLAAGRPSQPVMKPLYIDLAEDPAAGPRPIHLGFRSGVNYLRQYLAALHAAGINHVALNLRFNQADIEKTLQRLADELLPDFATAEE